MSARSQTSAVPSSKADFLLITALDEERRAVIGALPSPVRKLKQTRSDIRVYYYTILPQPRYRVVVMSVSAMGRTKAAVATTTAIQRWHPSAVLLVGIAGGVGARGVRLGDIVIAEQVVDYELQKIRQPAQGPRFQVYPSDPRLLQAAHNLPYSWQPPSRLRPEAGLSEVHFGPVATGDKVVARQPFLARLVKNWPQLVGIEMEAGGVAAACFDSAASTKFLMVRGISDLADESKGTSAVERWRRFACVVAARYAVTLMRSEPLPTLKRAISRRVAADTAQSSLPPDPPEPGAQSFSTVSPNSQNSPLRVAGDDFFGVQFITDRTVNGGNAYQVMDVFVRNDGSILSVDDVVVELRLPKGIGFNSALHGNSRTAKFGEVTEPILTSIHPGAKIRLGYLRRWGCEFGDDVNSSFFGTSLSKDVEWKVTARNTPAISGRLTVNL